MRAPIRRGSQTISTFLQISLFGVARTTRKSCVRAADARSHSGWLDSSATGFSPRFSQTEYVGFRYALPNLLD